MQNAQLIRTVVTIVMLICTAPLTATAEQVTPGPQQASDYLESLEQRRKENAVIEVELPGAAAEPHRELAAEAESLWAAGNRGPAVDVLTPEQREQRAEGLLAAFRLNLTALSLISLFVGLFLVFASTQASLVRRRIEFGVLRSMGATRRQVLGLMLVAFGTMGWFGVRKALGLTPEGLTRRGPYSVSRNPQILGGYLLVIGTSLQWPSIYSLGWVLMYAIIGHWMVMTEEEHLRRVFGEAFERYCSKVPRYLGPIRRGDGAG